jgi:hypothetical protein
MSQTSPNRRDWTHTGHVDRPKEHLKDRHRLDSSGGISATRG